MRLVELGDARLGVHEWGEPRRTPLLFWHALGPVASGRELVEIAPVLAAAGWRVLAVDGPGFGASPLLEPERYQLDALAELVERLVAALDLAPLVLMGHSWGGAVMLRFASRRPEQVRALVLVDSGHIDYADLPDVDAARTAEDWIAAAPILRWESRVELEGFLRDGLTRSTPALIQAYVSATGRDGPARIGPPPEARGAAMSGLTERISRSWPVLVEHRIPTLLLLATESPHGDLNREFAPRFQAAVPHADVRWVPGAGHGVLADVGPPLGAELAAWLGAQDLH